MNKNDLNLISAFIDAKNPKVELNYAYLGEDGIYASDTRKVIKFNIPMLSLDLMLDKKILKGFISVLSKDSQASIDGFGFLRTHGLKMSCDTWGFSGEKQNPDYTRILDTNYEKHFVLESIEDLQFELAQRNCFIDDVHLNPIIQFAECLKFNIFYKEQISETRVNGNYTNSSEVKIVGRCSTEDEVNIVKFTAVVMGRTFESKAQEDLL